MSILNINNLSKSYGIDEIFSGLNLVLNPGDKLGIIGSNGAGKSTLLGIISGIIEPSQGSVYIAKDASIAYMKQNKQFDMNASIIDESLREIKSYSSDEPEELRIKKLHSYLNAMGFSDEMKLKSISTLSGGERTRLALALTLIKKPEILLLDEPTNHLDLSMLDWLEDYLRSYRGTLLIISHDRYLLDRTTNLTYEISLGSGTLYHGNYSFYKAEKQARFESEQRAYEKQSKEIARQEEIIMRFKQHNTEHLVKRAKSREKRLAMLDTLDKPMIEQQSIKLSLDASIKSGNDVFIGENIGLNYGDKQVFNNINLHIRRGEKICIIGKNGIGKSSLMKILNGEQKPSLGSIKQGFNVTTAYYDQGQLLLDDSNTVLEEMKDEYHLYSDTEMRGFLGRFLFKDDDVFRIVRDLSGGERARLSLLKIMLKSANTLLLDEPTNHLDIASREVLEDALLEYDGTVIIISHDRYLLNRIPTRILEMTSSGFIEHLGNFDYYMGRARHLDPKLAKTLKATSEAAAERQARKEAAAINRSRARKLSETESKIYELENQIAELETAMCNPDKTSDYKWMQDMGDTLHELEDEVSRLYELWETLSQ